MTCRPKSKQKKIADCITNTHEIRVDYYFTTTVVSKHQWQELFSVCPYFFVINKFTTYTKYWDDRSGPTEQFLKCGGQWPPLLNLGGTGVDSYYIEIYFTILQLQTANVFATLARQNLSVLSLGLFRSVRLLNLSWATDKDLSLAAPNGTCRIHQQRFADRDLQRFLLFLHFV